MKIPVGQSPGWTWSVGQMWWLSAQLSLQKYTNTADDKFHLLDLGGTGTRQPTLFNLELTMGS